MLRCAQHDKAVPACHTLVGVPSHWRSAMSLKLALMGTSPAPTILDWAARSCMVGATLAVALQPGRSRSHIQPASFIIAVDRVSPLELQVAVIVGGEPDQHPRARRKVVAPRFIEEVAPMVEATRTGDA